MNGSDGLTPTFLQRYGFCRSDASNIATAIALGVVSIAFAPLLHTVSPVLTIAVQTLIACAIAFAAPAYVPLVALFSLIFQNLFISILSPLIGSPADVEFIKGYNFLLCATLWSISVVVWLTRYKTAAEPVNRFMVAGAGVLAVVGVYYLIGLAQNPLAATIYLRNITFPIMLFHLGLLAAASAPTRVSSTFVAFAIVLMICGYTEFFFRDFWLEITNGYSYWRLDEIKAVDSGAWQQEMKATGRVIVDFRDRFTFSFLNTPLLEGYGLSNFLRVFGPNIHAISFAYGVVFFSLFCFSIRRPIVASLAIPLALICGVKGALILMLFVIAGWMASRLVGYRVTLVLSLLGAVIYAVAGIYIGLKIGDYHVLGFFGGWNGFVHAPFGRGLGVGGNLSGDFAAIDWSAAQAAGAADFAVESAIGVLLNQMGIGALVPIAYYAAIGYFAWRCYEKCALLTQGFAALGILITLVNGIFQEEALFAPMALGLYLLLAGLVIGNAVRGAQSRAQDEARKIHASPSLAAAA